MRVWIWVVACVGCNLNLASVDVPITTNVPCSSLSTVIVVASNAGDSSGAQTQELSNECSGTTIGKADYQLPLSWNIELVVSATVDGSDPHTCASTPGSGCIVARRFVGQPNGEITVPVVLDAACAGLLCTPDQTCTSGICVSTH